MKATLIAFLLFLFIAEVNCQEKISLYYNSNWQVTKKEKAAYFREAEYDLENFKISGQVVDYSIDGKKIMEGNYTGGKRNGEFTFFFSNGETESNGSYLNNKRIGKWEYFYSNGKLKQIVVFRQIDRPDDFVVVDYFDREGFQSVKNGTGKWINDSIQNGIFDQTNLKRLTGQFKDSLKVGVWKLVRISDKKLLHSETFVNGRFIRAIVLSPAVDDYGTTSSEVMPKFPENHFKKFRNTESFELDSTAFSSVLLSSDVPTIFKTLTGKEYEIKNRKVMYPEGDYSLLEFLAKNIRYPISAIEGKIAGKVYVGAVIDSKGNLKDARILYGAHKDLDNEALRVVRLITKWLPALQDGTPVESNLAIPVTFELKD